MVVVSGARVQVACYLKTVFGWEHNIQDDQVRQFLMGYSQRINAVTRNDYFVPWLIKSSLSRLIMSGSSSTTNILSAIMFPH
jgi:hypothetical protein